MSAKKSRGRQKIKIEMIAKESHLHVTFSKRRYGLFKKASELSTLCGAEVGLVVFSPGKKVFSFGHPSLESIVNQYVSGNRPRTCQTMQIMEAHHNADVQDLNDELTAVLNQLEEEKKRGEELNQMMKGEKSQWWFANSIEEIDDTHLHQFNGCLENLKKNIVRQAKRLLMQNSAPPQFFQGSSSTGGISRFEENDGAFNANMLAHPSALTAPSHPPMMPPPVRPTPSRPHAGLNTTMESTSFSHLTPPAPASDPRNGFSAGIGRGSY